VVALRCFPAERRPIIQPAPPSPASCRDEYYVVQAFTNLTAHSSMVFNPSSNIGGFLTSALDNPRLRTDSLTACRSAPKCIAPPNELAQPLGLDTVSLDSGFYWLSRQASFIFFSLAFFILIAAGREACPPSVTPLTSLALHH
jgi:hypothetical protein